MRIQGSLLLLSTALLPAVVFSQPVYLSLYTGERSLLDFSLEELMAVEIKSASGFSTPWFHNASPVYVLDRERIERSAARTIPDLLRLVPGVQVASTNSHTWAVAVRGHNDFFSNKLLVMVDERPIYEWSTNGTLWYRQDFPLDLIERIEVVRGPGGTLWGANAVNGVINIVTRKVVESESMISAGMGNGDSQRADLFWRSGEESGWGYRWNLSLRESDPFGGQPYVDGWRRKQLGLRLDHGEIAGGTFSLTSQLGMGEIDHPSWSIAAPRSIEGREYEDLFLNARWESDLDNHSTLSLSGYGDYSDNSWPVRGESSALGIDGKYTSSLFENHLLQIGGGVRRMTLRAAAQEMLPEPFDNTQWMVQGYLQDEIRFAPLSLAWTVGTKVEQWRDSDLLWSPSTRLLWSGSDSVVLWASLSRAHRVPSTVERLVNMKLGELPPSMGGLPFYLAANPSIEPVRVDSLDLGLRYRFTDRLSVDISLFSNSYKGIVARLQQLVLPGGGAAKAPGVYLTTVNAIDERSRGVEAMVDWRNDEWRVQLGYSHQDSIENSSYLMSINGSSPSETAPDQLTLQLGRDWGNHSLDLTLRAVDRLCRRGLDGSQLHCSDSYGVVDLGWNWSLTGSTTLTLTAQNLGGDDHVEFYSDGVEVMIGTLSTHWMVELSHRF